MAADLPSEQRASYAAIIDKILADADLEKISAKAIRQGMQRRIDYDLAPQKAAITALIMERFDKVQREAEEASNNVAPVAEPVPTANGKHGELSPGKKRKADEESSEDDDLSEPDESPAPKKVKKVKPEAESDEVLAAKLQAQFNAQARSTRGGGATKNKKKSTTKKDKKPKKKSATKIRAEDDSELEGNESGDRPVKEKKGGFHQLMTLSEPLSAMLGESALSRPQTVKRIWAYVKERDLQDPGDKRQLRCDDAMRAVFKQDKVHMFTMNKLLANHLYPQEG